MVNELLLGRKVRANLIGGEQVAFVGKCCPYPYVAPCYYLVYHRVASGRRYAKAIGEVGDIARVRLPGFKFAGKVRPVRRGVVKQLFLGVK